MCNMTQLQYHKTDLYLLVRNVHTNLILASLESKLLQEEPVPRKDCVRNVRIKYWDR
jgi:hypothetical protein